MVQLLSILEYETMNQTIKILLISANRLTAPYPVYPLGIAYIETHLREKMKHAEIRSFDLNMNSLEDLCRELNDFSPKYIAVSIRNIDGVNSYDPVSFIAGYKEIMETIRREYQQPHYTIIGGAGFSIFPMRMFEILQPDFAVSGEGEISLHKLISALENSNDFTTIEGLLYRKSGQVFMNSIRKEYTNPNLNFDNALVDFYWVNSGMLNIQTKRGCPFHCIYCTYPVIEGKKVRILDPAKVVETLVELYRKSNIDYVFFTDSVFNMQNDYNAELAERIISSGIQIQWGAYFYPKGMDEKLLALLKKSGLTHIEFGTESICDKTLAAYRKHFSVADIMDQSEICHKLDIPYAHFLILAGYGDSDENINITFENSKRIKQTVFFPFVGMRIYPGTPLYDLALAEGRISPDDDLIEPKYYIEKSVNLDTLKERANATKRRWVFPDEDTSVITNRMRKLRNKKGPLWEYLIS
jgi:radical SAM superfamily enzyme YgiQ (UPF0313 family)